MLLNPACAEVFQTAERGAILVMMTIYMGEGLLRSDTLMYQQRPDEHHSVITKRPDKVRRDYTEFLERKVNICQ